MPARVAAFLEALKSFPRRRPVLFGVGFSCSKTSFADYLVQKFVEKREEIDIKRNLSFASFGFVYLGGIQYALYVPIFGRLFPNAAAFAAKPLIEKLADKRGMGAVVAQVALDQCVHHPLMYFPAFYMTRECIEKGAGIASVQAALEKYRANMKEDMVALWKVWVPVTFMNFALSPMWMRIPVVATTSLGWTCILSAMRGASNEIEMDPLVAMDSIGNKGRAFSRLRHKDAQLDPAKTHIVLTAVGPSGLTSLPRLAQIVMEGTGNVIESRGMRMGPDLTVMMLIEVSPDKSSQLTERLQERETDPLLADFKIFTHVTEPTAIAAAATAAHSAAIKRSSRFKMAAIDRPGLLHMVTSFLEKQGLSILDVNCEQRDTFIEGESKRLFFMDGLVAGEVADRAAFTKQLRDLKKSHGVSLQLTANPS